MVTSKLYTLCETISTTRKFNKNRKNGRRKNINYLIFTKNNQKEVMNKRKWQNFGFVWKVRTKYTWSHLCIKIKKEVVIFYP